jgi:hypothetical protein
MAAVELFLEPPFLIIDSSGYGIPFRNQRIKGSGLPPELEQVNSMARPSVAEGSTGVILGGPGGNRTVNWKVFE